jgi:hypothetical protein
MPRESAFTYSLINNPVVAYARAWIRIMTSAAAIDDLWKAEVTPKQRWHLVNVLGYR